MTDLDLAPRAPMEFRSAQLVEVRFPKREIELVVMPYEEIALVEYPLGSGRLIREICTRGAYDGCERRANRIKVNRDHDLGRSCGRALALHPSREVGLVAELRISPTALGDETLALAEDGVLDASAGFAPFAGGEQWLENRSLRRLTRCFLGHIALVPDPAYDGANVLALRAAIEHHPSGDPPRIPTPNLDQVRLWALEERYRETFGD